MLPIDQIIPELEQPKKIFITCHTKPDADAIGSTLGLYHYLLQKGHQPSVVSPSEIPDFLMWMPGIETVYNFEAEPKLAQKVLDEAELIFCLDFNHLSRTKSMEAALREAKQPKVLIDHHLLPEDGVFYCGISQPEKSSTCEMVYDFIDRCGDKELIDNNVATCLYTGTMTDTGSFRFPATDASVHDMISFFKKRGLKHSEIHENVYDTNSENRLRFLGFALYEKMEVFLEGKIGLIALRSSDMAPFNLSSGDTEGLVNYPLSITGVQIAVLITERNDEIKMSFRSKGNVDVSTYARTYFNGGGHFNAAGGKSFVSFDETVQLLKTTINNLVNNKTI